MSAREISPVDITRACLDKIRQQNASLHAFITVDEDGAMAAARRAEVALMAGHAVGPLHGIPYAVKDNYLTKTLLTTYGSRLYLDHRPDFDATLVERMNAAGAILLGKLNTFEFGTGTGEVFCDLAFPDARNPWRTTHFTGGSSTGAGAAAAAGLATITLGSDTGGSVRLPAAACGVQGLKPTYGRVSRYGILPNCYSLDVPGPLAWTVEDCARALQVLAGHDPRDPACAVAPVPDYLARLRDGVAGMRIGIVRDLGPETELIDAANLRGMEDMARVLQLQGAMLVDVRLPVPPQAYRQVSAIINASESFSAHEKDFLERGSEMGLSLRDKMMFGFSVRAADYIAALRRRRELAQMTQGMFESVDAVLIPGAYHVAPPFDDHAALKAFTSDTACHVFNVSGHPAISLCTGFDAAGLPTNGQIVGRWFDEATLLRVARTYEAATAWRDRRPGLPSGVGP
jgi:aspartyl-tRNA(Asn)/glutamyl-tRNA(Gln) amidotransferase subunit A